MASERKLELTGKAVKRDGEWKCENFIEGEFDDQRIETTTLALDHAHFT
jgi:hypothetical protein